LSQHNEESFRDMTMKQKIGTIAGLTLFIFFILGLVIGIYLFGMAGIFKLLGIEYTSIWSLTIFVVSFFVLSTIVELFSKPITGLLTRKITGKAEVLSIQFGVQSLTNWLCLFTVGEFMGSITLTFEAGVIIAMLLTIIEMVFEDKDKEKTIKKSGTAAENK